MAMTTQMVGMIDGENVAFALVRPGAESRLEAVRQFKTTEFPTFTDALQGYTRDQQISTVDLPLGLAVAGVSRGDVISLANCRWYISVSGLKSFLGQEPLIINDFAATAWSLIDVEAQRLKPIGAVAPRVPAPGRTFLVVGTGPGLGAATLVIRDQGAIVLDSEGGHSSFSPQSEREDRLLAWLRRKYGHVSFERLVSYLGLENIHCWLGESSGRPPSSSDQIVAAALRGDSQAREAVEIFASALGSFAGNQVLSAGAWDGIFLVGSMLRQIMPLLEGPAFRSAEGESASLAGAAAALAARSRELSATS
jgi:glucokinase